MKGPSHNTNTMIALYNFEAEEEPEMSLKKGEHIDILDMDPALNGWAYARRRQDDREGYVPISYLGTSNSMQHNVRHNHSHNHKHSKGLTGSRSSSPLPNSGSGGGSNKSRYNDQRNAYRNASSNNPNNGYSHHGMPQQQQQDSNSGGGNHHHHHHNQQAQSNMSGNSGKNSANSSSNALNAVVSGGGGNSSNSSSVTINNNEPNDGKQLICSFHRDFIPEMSDLYKYFGEYGKITNKLEIEYDSKKVPLAKIRFQRAETVDKVCGKGNRQQIPSGAQNSAIYIRVYRSMQEYVANTQRQNRGHGGYNKHKNNRRGGF